MPFTVDAIPGKSRRTNAPKSREPLVNRRRSKETTGQGRSSTQQGVLIVKFSIAWAAVAAGFLPFCFAASLLAQGAGGAPSGAARSVAPVAPVRPSGTNVAVIDISLVFENFPGFQKKMEELKGQVEAFEGEMKAEGAKMMKKKEQLDEYAKGSDNFKRLEEEMARTNSGMQIKVAKQRREFLEQEAKIYYEGYNEVLAAVSLLAERNDIKLVLRFSSEPMRADDRNSVLQSVNRPIVYQKNLNITNLVIQALGGSMAKRDTTPGSKSKTRTE
jgi:Skp family chaperone for outer membrane proteins